MKEVTFPLYARSRFNDDIVKFTDHKTGTVIVSKCKERKGYTSNEWRTCLNISTWEILHNYDNGNLRLTLPKPKEETVEDKLDRIISLLSKNRLI